MQAAEYTAIREELYFLRPLRAKVASVLFWLTNLLWFQVRHVHVINLSAAAPAGCHCTMEKQHSYTKLLGVHRHGSFFPQQLQHVLNVCHTPH